MPEPQWQKVVYAYECVEFCPDCMELICPVCICHYSDCDCPGPDQDDQFEYEEREQGLFARRKVH
jgi:hypothetical protein